MTRAQYERKARQRRLKKAIYFADDIPWSCGISHYDYCA